MGEVTIPMSAFKVRGHTISGWFHLRPEKSSMNRQGSLHLRLTLGDKHKNSVKMFGAAAGGGASSASGGAVAGLSSLASLPGLSGLSGAAVESGAAGAGGSPTAGGGTDLVRAYSRLRVRVRLSAAC
jgi:hypothetical protein